MGPGGEKVLTICARRCKKGVGSCEEVDIWKCGTGREVDLVDVSQHLKSVGPSTLEISKA